MFIAVLIIIAKMEKSPNMYQLVGNKQMCYIYAMGYCLAIKTINTYYNIDEPQICKGPDTKDYILCNSVYMKFMQKASL